MLVSTLSVVVVLAFGILANPGKPSGNPGKGGPGTGCNGDPNAMPGNISACPPSCEWADPTGRCTKAISQGCPCIPGYIYSRTEGRCVRPKECPDGEPICVSNGAWVDCLNFDCALYYCPTEDSRSQINCGIERSKCYGGCKCYPGYIWRSYEERYCVKLEECPYITCKNPNEYYSYSPPKHYRENCGNGNTADNDPNYVPLRPRCVCQIGFCRNSKGECVPDKHYSPVCTTTSTTTMLVFLGIFILTFTGSVWSDSCCDTGSSSSEESSSSSESCDDTGEDTPPEPVICGCNETYTGCVKNEPTCDNLDPDTSSSGSSTCKPGCTCKPGYVRMTWIGPGGGTCIARNDCPGCNCSENETCKNCPSPCQPTCDNPKPQICPLFCMIRGCECNPGLIRDRDGNCIHPSKCPAPTTMSTTHC